MWQELREELKDKNFEVFTVDCDTKGAAVAERWIKAANPQHPSVLDERHLVPELYNTRNVPAVFWIDEEGLIVRANDPIYVSRRNRDTGATEKHEKYLAGVRDWVEKGPRSIYLQDNNKLKARTGQPTADDALAMAFFRLGVYLNQQGHAQDAIPHFKRAHQLQPKNLNYKRQAWSLGNIEQDYGYTMQQALQDPATGPSYPPLDLPEPTKT